MVFADIFDRQFAPHLERREQAFRLMLVGLDQVDQPNIVETGCVRKEGNWNDGQSTLIFDRYVQEMGGTLTTVDIAAEHCDLARMLTSKADVVCSDSVRYLYERAMPPQGPAIDLLYLDSYDVDFDSPHPAALHHLKELCGALRLLSPQAVIAVDDNLTNDGAISSGKGLYVSQFMADIGAELLHAGYVHVWSLDRH